MKKKLIATGLITVLAASNGYMAYTYIKDTDELKNDIVKSQQENREKDEQLSYLGNNIIKLQDDLKNKITDNEKLTVKLDEVKGKIKKQDNQIDKLEQELEKAKKRNESPRKLNIEITAYQAYCTEGCTGITRTGYDISNTVYYQGMRVIATDPSVIPLYSIVEIKLENGKIIKAISLDTGGAINNYKVDYLVASQQEAINFGRQKASLTIIREGKG